MDLYDALDEFGRKQGHPMVVGRSDALALAHVCAPLQIK